MRQQNYPPNKVSPSAITDREKGKRCDYLFQGRKLSIKGGCAEQLRKKKKKKKKLTAVSTSYSDAGSECSRRRQRPTISPAAPDTQKDVTLPWSCHGLLYICYTPRNIVLIGRCSPSSLNFNYFYFYFFLLMLVLSHGIRSASTIRYPFPRPTPSA